MEHKTYYLVNVKNCKLSCCTILIRLHLNTKTLRTSQASVFPNEYLSQMTENRYL